MLWELIRGGFWSAYGVVSFILVIIGAAALLFGQELGVARWILAMIAVAAVAWGVSAIYHKQGYIKARTDLKREALQKRYELIYAPLQFLFTDVHIATAQVILYPEISHRIRRAWPYLRRLNIRHGLRRLFDKGASKPASYIEYGKPFPLEQIKKVIEKGRISNKGRQYCYITSFHGFNVLSRLNKKSDCFVILDKR